MSRCTWLPRCRLRRSLARLEAQSLFELCEHDGEPAGEWETDGRDGSEAQEADRHGSGQKPAWRQQMNEGNHGGFATLTSEPINNASIG